MPGPTAEHDPVARVLVDVPLAHLDRTFDYSVPADMDHDARPGVRVKVRFAGRDVDGFLLERGAASDHDGSLAVERDGVQLVVGRHVAQQRHVGGAVAQSGEGLILGEREQLERAARHPLAPDPLPLAGGRPRHERDDEGSGHVHEATLGT